MSIDAQILKKKISRTCDEAARIVLSSLLVYVLARTDGPQRAEDAEHRASRPLHPQESGQRPTRFQLLQAKFMGTGREPHLKRTREVGRLIYKDKQGRSLVNATINKLMGKTKEGASIASQRPLTNEKPRWGPPSGKNTVKNILKKFLAAEEKEDKEKAARDKPPAQRSGAARGLLPKILGRSSILSKLRERFEQNSCLHSEAGVLPLHREERKSKSLQKKRVHRPQVRVLHIATMATSNTRTPPARFLACTAEPLPALSIATIVCGPQSWLSHCAKISHLESRRWPGRQTSMSPNSEDLKPGGNKPSGSLSEEPRELRPSKSSVLQIVAPVDSHVALNMPGSSCMSSEGKALPGHIPALSSLGLASPRDAGPAGGDRTMEPKAQEVANHTQRVKKDSGEAPEITMAMCSSEDEAERPAPDSERELLFAVQRQLPEQEVVASTSCLAPPSVQAERRAQAAIEPPQITVRLPIVHEMPAPPAPLQSAVSHDDKCSRIMGGETLSERPQAVFSVATEDRRGHQAPVILSKPCGITANHDPGVQHGPQEDLRNAATVSDDTPQTVLTPKQSTRFPSRKETKLSLGSPHDPQNRSSVSGQTISELNQEKLPESDETPAHNHGATSDHSALKSLPGEGTCSLSGTQQGTPTIVLVPSQDSTRPESSTAAGKSVQHRQEESRRPLEESAPPPGVSLDKGSQDLGNNQLDEQPAVSGSEETAAGAATSTTMPQPGGTQDPKHKKMPQLDGAREPEHEIMPWAVSAQDTELIKLQPYGTQAPKHKKMPQPDGAQDPEYKKMPQSDSAQDPEHKIMPQENRAYSTSPPDAAQDTKFRITPQTDGAQNTDHKRTPLVCGAQGTENKTALWAGSVQNTEDKMTQEASSHHFSAPGRFSKRKSEATEGSISGYVVQSQLLASAVPTAQPGQAAGSCLAPTESQPCISSESAEANSGAAAGGRNAAMERDPLRYSMTSPSPQKSPKEGLSQSHVLSVDQQALDRKSPKQEQLPPLGAAYSPENPSKPAMSEETRQVRQIQGQEPPAPVQQADHRAFPQAKSLECGGKESQLTQVDMGRPESHLGPQITGTGHMRSYHAEQPGASAQRREALSAQKAMVCVTESQAQDAQVLAGNKEIPVVENPHQHRGQVPQRPSGRQQRNPAQRDSPQAVENSATPGNPERPSCLSAQAQTQALGQSSLPVPQGWGQSDSTTEGIITAGTSREPQRLRVISQGSPGAQHLPQESQSLADSTAPCTLEPMHSSSWPTTKVGVNQPLQSPAQDGLPSTPVAERDLSDLKHGRSVHFAKYHAQSFSDQRAFDLSFRPTVLRASDTFEPPK